MSYSDKTKREADFIAKYSLLPNEDGSLRTYRQYIRSDFLYEGDDPKKDGVYMIWPEFLSDDLRPIPEGAEIPQTGYVSMWIFSDEMIDLVHSKRLHVGAKGYFTAGSCPVGELFVVELIRLKKAMS